jgi:hypothetical protein
MIGGPLTPVPTWDIIKSRLPEIFPEGTDNRTNLISKNAVKTVYVLFYTGAVEGHERWIRPSQVLIMTDDQATKINETDRVTWTELSLKPGARDNLIDAWGNAGSRETIRDEVITNGLVANNALITRPGVITTSPLPRYAMKKEFAALFDPSVEGADLQGLIKKWQEKFLSKAALARVKVVKSGKALSKDPFVLINEPNGVTRQISPGPSSVIAKAVVEVFAKEFLESPLLAFLSEPNNKTQDDALAQSIGLKLSAEKDLPDIILIDVPENKPMKIIFVEVVYSSGPMHQKRKEAFEKLALESGHEANNVFYISAFEDKESKAFKKYFASIAWGTFAWFASEPKHLLNYTSANENKISLSEISNL